MVISSFKKRKKNKFMLKWGSSNHLGPCKGLKLVSFMFTDPRISRTKMMAKLR